MTVHRRFRHLVCLAAAAAFAVSLRSVIFRARDFDPGSRPPCDIRPAFSEPLC